jgi:dipeptidyl aminopeptidase/acylaminoacyl peptidase
MPWDGSWLWVAWLDERGGRLASPPQHVAGGPAESATQPQWSPDGVLHFISDRPGWQSLFRWRHGQVEAVLRAEADLGAAPWEFGYATYAFLRHGEIAVLAQSGPATELCVLRADGALTSVRLPYTSIKPYLATDGRKLALIGASPRQPPTLALVDPASGQARELAGGIRGQPWLAVVSEHAPGPARFSFPTRDGALAHGLYHPPATPPPAGAPAGRPPLIVRAHPGPTANTALRLDPAVVFFTSRGFAVADIDYRGSTGYGRAYRQALRGRWGELDAHDCADAVAHLAATGHADPGRAVITGASAGGYTALRALAATSAFQAATARSAIIDPAAWRQAAPAFQRCHADALIGPWPAAAHACRQRCPLARPDQITRPVLLLHGEEDPVAPASHVRALAAALTAQGTPATARIYPGEGHSIRRPEHAIDALRAELDHYRHALGLAAR